VEVAATATPPVCKILDYGKFRYEAILRRKRRYVAVRGRRPVEGEYGSAPVKDHDLDIKMNRAKKFIVEGDKVKVLVVFRGRQVVHPELGIRLLQKVANDLKGIAS